MIFIINTNNVNNKGWQVEGCIVAAHRDHPQTSRARSRRRRPPALVIRANSGWLRACSLRPQRNDYASSAMITPAAQ